MTFLALFNAFSCILTSCQVDDHNKLSTRDSFPGAIFICRCRIYCQMSFFDFDQLPVLSKKFDFFPIALRADFVSV